MVVGNVTTTKLLILVIVPDSLQLIVKVAGHGAVCVIVNLNGSSDSVIGLFTSVILINPSVLLPLLLIVVDVWASYANFAPAKTCWSDMP